MAVMGILEAARLPEATQRFVPVPAVTCIAGRFLAAGVTTAAASARRGGHLASPTRGRTVMPARTRAHRADIVIAGGGLGGCAAALAALRAGPLRHPQPRKQTGSAASSRSRGSARRAVSG